MLRFGLLVTLGVSALSGAHSLKVDLKTLGYRSPISHDVLSLFEYNENPRHLIFDLSNSVYVWFVRHDEPTRSEGRESPSVQLHIFRFNQKGELDFEWVLPINSDYSNTVIPSENGNILIQRGANITLFSSSHNILFQRQIVGMPMSIQPLGDGRNIALLSHKNSGYDLQIVNLDDLTVRTSCSSGFDRRPMSVARLNALSMLSNSPGAIANTFLRRVIVGRICGSTSFFHTWEKGATSATMLNDNTFLTAGNTNTITVFSRDQELWSHKFQDRRDQVSSLVSVDASGRTFVIAIKTLTGGFRVLDLPSHLKALRLVAFRSFSGQPLQSWPVDPLPNDLFDFRVSPDGTRLGFISGGVLYIKLIDQK